MTLAHPDPALEQAHRAALHAGPKAAADALLAAMALTGRPCQVAQTALPIATTAAT